MGYKFFDHTADVLFEAEGKTLDELFEASGLATEETQVELNGIKQKNESLIQEIVEKNGKKRLFIEEEIKEKILKNVKVREKYSKKD